MTGTGRAAGGTEFRLPDLGEGLTDAEITAWLVQPGDVVEADQVVVVVETAKATVELPSPYAGLVTRRHGEVGDVIEVGHVLLEVSPTMPTMPIAPATGPAPRPAAVLVGSGAPVEPVRRARARVRPPGAGAAPFDGRASRADLAGAPAADRADDSADDSADQQPAAGTTRIRLQGRRRAVADKVTRAHREIPAVTCWVEADASGLLAARDALRPSGIGLLALLARITVAGLRRFPELNGHFDPERDEVVRSAAVHLGLAVDTERGLLLPVLRNAQDRTTAELAAEITSLIRAAREGGPGRAEAIRATMTLNNYGVFGVDGSTPILNHPEVAMLGIGRIARKPWVVGDTVAVRPVVQLSVTFDHRVCDGGPPSGFLRYVADCVEQPVFLLAEA